MHLRYFLASFAVPLVSAVPVTSGVIFTTQWSNVSTTSTSLSSSLSSTSLTATDSSTSAAASTSSIQSVSSSSEGSSTGSQSSSTTQAPSPTITVTSTPSGFSTSATTNSQWSTNTVITTTASDGSQTIVPVLVGCKKCGGSHGGIILWGTTPGEVFDLPDLPTFEIPTDSEAPVTEDDTDDDTSSTQSASSTSAESTTASSTTSSSSSSSSSSQSSSSTSSSTSSAATSTATKLMIVAKNTTSQSDIDDFSNTLTSQIDEDDILYTSNLDSGVTIWYAPLNDTQVTEFKKNSIIDDIVSDTTTDIDDFDPDSKSSKTRRKVDGSAKYSGGYKRQVSRKSKTVLKERGTTDYQNPANTELKVFSQTQDYVNQGISAANLNDFAYDSTAGQGITVYVMDTGVNLGSSEISGSAGSAGWIFTDSKIGDKSLTQAELQAKYSSKENDPNGHGSCVFSKVNSASFGTAKKSNMMIVKISDQVTTFEVLDGLNSILNHVKQNNLQKKAVVNLSLGLSESSFNAVTAVLLQQVLGALNSLGVVIVCAAGNFKNLDPSNPRVNVDTYPALLADRYPLIVVGGVDNDGNQYANSQEGSLVTTWAPAVDIECAYNVGDQTQLLTGTSFAAPAVAGVVAYYLGMEISSLDTVDAASVGTTVRDFIKQRSFARVSGGNNVLWNGAQSNYNCNSKSNKRDTSCSVLSSASASGSSTASATSDSSTSASTTTSASSSATTVSSSSTGTTSSSSSTGTAVVVPSDTPLCLGGDGATYPVALLNGDSGNITTFCEALVNNRAQPKKYDENFQISFNTTSGSPQNTTVLEVLMTANPCEWSYDITTSTCEEKFGLIANDCDTSSGNKHGGWITDGICMTYSMLNYATDN